jgi:Tol biopolymer transport system component
MIDGKVHGFDYEGQRMYGLNTWYEEGKVSIYASNTADHTLGVFTFDCETNELVDTASYDIQSAHFVRDAGNFLVYVKSVNGKDQTSQYGLEIYDKTTGENKTVARDIATLGSGFQLIVLNGDKSKVLFAKTKDEAHALYEYDIPTGEIREIYECKKGDIITGFTYALGSNKIYVRYGKKSDAIVGYVCRPNHTKVITTDGRKYDLHFSFIDGYDWNGTGIVIY